MYIIPVSARGRELAALLQRELGGSCISLSDVSQRWSEGEAFLFVGAVGICVRTIAPLLADKHSDPAVVCVDACGGHAVSVASGHVGGANDLARRVARITGGEAVITTQSDCVGLWPLDTLGDRFGWTLADEHINAQIALFVNRAPTALLLDIRDEGTDWLEAHLPEHVSVFHRAEDLAPSDFQLLILVSPRRSPLPALMSDEGKPLPVVHYIPRVLHVGLGLARQAQPVAGILQELRAAVETRGYCWQAIARFATISAKRDEPVVEALQGEGQTVRFYEAAELSAVPVPNPSATVAKHMQTPSVSEAAAVLSSAGGPLVAEKQKGTVWTLAIALDRRVLTPPNSSSDGAAAGVEGMVEIVGAGPGDSELISVRGQRLLAEADLVLYAGSLVPRALTEGVKPGCVVRSSAGMTLEEQFALMKAHYARGHLIVRLHTGDPCLYGAIEEQMALMDRAAMRYRITPGISAFQAAAAELKSQFTIPRRVQTVILTRGEGHTPMPPLEQLHLLARAHSTMCIYLSADIVESVEAELLREYPPSTPVAVCYRLTWPEQRILRGRLCQLAALVRDNGLSLHTLLVVGEAIDNREGRSELYDEHFSHLFRKGTNP